MSGVDVFEIFFSEIRPYLEGQEVCGHVMLECSQDIVMERLIVEFCGVAKLKCGKKPKNKSNSEVRKQDGEENPQPIDISSQETSTKELFLNQKFTIYRRGLGSFLIPAGRHPYAFQIQLPFGLPSTISGRHGSIYYYCEATLTRPFQPQQTTKRPFVVHSVTDLTAHPLSWRPLKSDLSVTHSLLSCLGRIHVRWRVDRLGYLPNESIMVRGRISNCSLLHIHSTAAILFQNIRYSCKERRRTYDQREVCRVTKGAIPAGQKDIWREAMLIPEIPPTGLNGTKLMELWYTLTLRITGSALLRPHEVSSDVIIGSTVGATDGQWSSHIQRSLSAEDLHAGEDTLDMNYFV